MCRKKGGLGLLPGRLKRGVIMIVRRREKEKEWIERDKVERVGMIAVQRKSG